MDRTLPSVTFEHPSLRGDNNQVVVFQNLESPSSDEEGTARWVWPGATATATWLCKRGEDWIAGKNIVELGSGTGLLGLVASKLGASSVTLTDLPSELPLLETNAAKNVLKDASPLRVTVEPLTWGDTNAIDKLLGVNTNNPIDVVLCCDLLYQNSEDVQRALARTMRRLLMRDDKENKKASPKKTKKRALFAYQFRENVLADSVFFEEIDELFGDPIRHETSDEDLWLMEYAVSS